MDEDGCMSPRVSLKRRSRKKIKDFNDSLKEEKN